MGNLLRAPRRGHRRSCRRPCRRPFQDTAGPGTQPTRRYDTPANRSCTYARSAALIASFAGFGRERPVRMPLRCGCPIVQPPLRVAALRRNSARSSTLTAHLPAISRTPAPAHVGSQAPPVRKRQISPGERLRRSSKHRWWHAACLPEPSCSDSLRHTGRNRSVLTCHARRNGGPEPSPLIASCHGRSTW